MAIRPAQRGRRATWIVNGMAALDRFLMLLPGFKRLASTCVLHGHPAQSDS